MSQFRIEPLQKPNRRYQESLNKSRQQDKSEWYSEDRIQDTKCLTLATQGRHMSIPCTQHTTQAMKCETRGAHISITDRRNYCPGEKQGLSKTPVRLARRVLNRRDATIARFDDLLDERF